MSNKKVIDLTSFGLRLREERLRLGFNQTDFAEIGGVQKDGQVKYEAGKREPGIGYLAALATAGVDIGFLLDGTISMASSDDELELLYYYRSLDARSKSSVLGLADSLRPDLVDADVMYLDEEEYKVLADFANKEGVSVDVMARRIFKKGYELTYGKPLETIPKRKPPNVTKKTSNEVD